jgi:dihydrofolate reductase
MQHGAIDDYRIWIHPVALGAGKRLFPDGLGLKGLTLRETHTTGKGVVILALDAAR